METKDIVVQDLDVRDRKILFELDTNFRQSFSKIGKKVGLSKNSVGLRFAKLSKYMLHNTLGLNSEVLGYTLVKVYYSFNFYNDEIEKLLLEKIKKTSCLRWIEKFYGCYDIAICILVQNLDQIISQVESFDHIFAEHINTKDVEILTRQYYFRYNFLHDSRIHWVSRIEHGVKKVTISSTDRDILKHLLYAPRENVVQIANSLGISSKTVYDRKKSMEKSGVIMGYFLTLDVQKFGYNTFKLLIQVQDLQKKEEFEKFIHTIKNAKFYAKVLGKWDYEIDLIFPSMSELQDQIEIFREKFPKFIKKLEIMSLKKRLYTNKDLFCK